jgi:hypothetical protein
VATATLTADKTQVAPGGSVTFAAKVTGLNPPVSTTAAGHIDATLSDGTTVSGDSQAIQITKPGQTVVSQTVTFQGSVLTAAADGTYTATVK